MQHAVPVEPQIKVDTSFNPFLSSTPSTSSGSTGKSFSTALNNAGFGTQSAAKWDEFWNPEDVREENVTIQQTLEIVDNKEIPTGPFQLKGSFIISTIKEGILVIHYRRAYERMLYEELMRGFFLQPLGSQQLIFPLEKQFSKQDKLSWDEHSKTLERIGFSWDWSDHELLLNGIPEVLNESTVLTCIDTILEQIQHGSLEKGEVAHTAMSQLAFAGSMSYSIASDQEALKQFIERLFEIEEHAVSPTGKRVMALISNEQLLQLF
jgi:DNA mismatch repair protein MutL